MAAPKAETDVLVNGQRRSLSFGEKQDANTAYGKAGNSVQQTPTKQVATINAQRETARVENARAEFWTNNRQSLDPVLTGDMKADLAYNETVFTVVSVQFRTGGQYGDTWWAKVDIDGMRFGAPFQDNEARHDFYANLRDFVQHNGPMPVSMRMYETTAGPGYDLCEPYSNDGVDTESSPSL